MTLDKATATLALSIARTYLTDYESYLAQCEEDRADGFRPRQCEHGTDLWTDYDNICGSCEDGLSMRDYVTRLAMARHEAIQRTDRASKIISAVIALQESGLGDAVDTAATAREAGRLLRIKRRPATEVGDVAIGRHDGKCTGVLLRVPRPAHEGGSYAMCWCGSHSTDPYRTI